MCGIIGYLGKKEALPILIQGLKRLEYRGYDSTGVAILENGKINRVRQTGKIEKLQAKLKNKAFKGNFGIAHTRWATHGEITEENAHPHLSCDHKIAVVHNGIIENYQDLKKMVEKKHDIVSETDSELIAHLIEANYYGNIKDAVVQSLCMVRGTYGILVMHQDHPDTLIAARFGSPLVFGLADDGIYLASDTSPILPHTRQVIFLDDQEVAEIKGSGYQVYNLKDEIMEKEVEKVDWNDEQANKQGFKDYMLKEIFDQPRAFEDAIRGRLNRDEGSSVMGGLNMTDEQIRSIDKILLLACGTAAYAAMSGKYIFERLTKIPTEVDFGSEFRYRDPIIDKNTLVFAVSQSGETADTLAGLREAKRKGAHVKGIVNVVGSTIARETSGGTYMHAGPELAVASTKAYTNMITVMILYALQFGRMRQLSVSHGLKLIKELSSIPEKMNLVFKHADVIEKLADKYKNYKNFLYLGRGINYPVALEGSHKLKEISYIHSEAYPAGEMKHGMNALLDQNFPVMAIMTKNHLYEKMRNNVMEVKARKSPIIIIGTENDYNLKEITDDLIYVPLTNELFEPIINTIPLQLFSYYVADKLGRDIDHPRNLAKSVTVE